MSLMNGMNQMNANGIKLMEWGPKPSHGAVRQAAAQSNIQSFWLFDGWRRVREGNHSIHKSFHFISKIYSFREEWTEMIL